MVFFTKGKYLPGVISNSLSYFHIFHTCRKSCEGLHVIPQGEEVHNQGYSDEDEAPAIDDTDMSFTRSGLHRVVSDPVGSENTALYIITETRLRDLAKEARSACRQCSQPLEVGVTASGSSAHITWVSNVFVMI